MGVAVANTAASDGDVDDAASVRVSTDRVLALVDDGDADDDDGDDDTLPVADITAASASMACRTPKDGMVVNAVCRIFPSLCPRTSVVTANDSA